MKKIMTICFFAFAIILGNQSATAQSKVEINALAAKKTEDLKKVLKFDTDTEHKVYEIYKAFGQKKQSVVALEAKNKVITQEEKKKMDQMLTDEFKKIFTEEEFKRYTSFEDKQKESL